ncbi:CubicO group peptidase (beta-lactamase class C family) [Paenibacillus phyllosphaerae]|uniref:CubicO group peptidase (Beta-lactamase class C family) n=1 Tax=Paenibacillus phyllosphaerae TaxID=274593 RepID=A0A7W5AU11_9BACL|nr:serine hydrolase [Paenibacillus phyllosphaerae]MBB3108617.1 CubicO group peptidase (beta-lactamase class C family) [Paenibacillus phyllosphaerae]
MSRKRSTMKTTSIMLTALLTAAMLTVPASVYATAPVQLTQTASSNTASAAEAAVPVNAAAVQAFADQFFARPEIAASLAGALAVVVKDDQILLNKGYGYADVAAKKAIDPDTTLFRMASITKSVTSTAVMQLVEQGKIDLKQDISAYMPEIKIPNDTGVPVTVEHLMTHTTGFDYTDSVMSAEEGKEVSIHDLIQAETPTVVRTPGEAYRYDNIAFTMQGYIVQNVSGQPFDTYVEEHIFEPLQMDHATMRLTKEAADNLATGYTIDKEAYDAYPVVPTVAPEGGMLASGSDMANFLIAHLDNGQFGDARILQEQTAKNMHDIHYSLADGEVPIVSYGFESFFHQKHNDQLVIGKGGDLPGYHSWMWMLPEHKVGGLIITNSDVTVSVREAFFAAFMDHFYPKKQSTTNYLSSTKQQLARFEGIYRGLRTPLMASNITAEEGYLVVTDAMGTHKLKQTGPLLFEDEIGAPAAFKEDEQGGIAYFYYNSPDSMSEKTATPAAYDDVASDHPYADSIYLLRSLEALGDEGEASFQPASTITRADFVSILTRLSGLKPSQQPAVFADLEGHPAAAYVQTIVELGGLTGTPDQRFEPDRPITRQEAAAILWRVAHLALNAPPVEADLKTAPAPWALEGVQYVVGSKLYGPEVVIGADGAAEYNPQSPMLKQEAAALLAKFISKVLSV